MDILTGTILKIIEYTVEPIGRQVGYLINYKSNLESLRSQLKNLDAAKDRIKHRVDEAERNVKGVETDVQNWRKEADGITQEAENILGNEGQAKTKCFRGVCPNLVLYHQFSRKSAKLAKKIEFHARKEFPSVSYEAPVEDIRAIPSQEYMDFESRTSMLKQIMEELKNPDTNMIGVYGLGGVGKTTLAEKVFSQVNEEEKLFDDVVLILNVKGKKDMEIQKEIAEQLRMEAKDQSMEVRANCLWHRIKDKKTLVILDDVLGKIDLKAVGLVVGRTCNLLLTSRDWEVLFYEMRTQKNFQLDLLCDQDSLRLFEKRACAAIKDDDRIQRVAKELAKKCGGLPILVVAVASRLRESALEEWKDTLRRFKNFEKKGWTEIPFLIIEWSYNKLNSEELKPLFLLCGIMAQSNNAFSLSDLLKYSIGMGLVENVRTVEEARNALHSLVKKLKNSCLLLDGYHDGSVRMHDVVRDVAVRIASRDQHVLSRAYTELDESPSKDCSLISLRRCTIPKLPDVPWECPELNFFYLGSSDISLEIPRNFFEKMEELKVLDLTQLHFPSLPPSLQSLTNLQTLCLNMCVLGDIALVGKLTNLKILSLLYSQVKELPKEIGQLTRLQLLDLTGCSELVVIPSGVISSLTSLEDLRMRSFKQWERGLNDGRSNASVLELKQLRHLTALEIHIPDAKLLPANMFLNSDTKLERYTILIGDCWQYHYFNETSSNMLKLKLTTNSQFDQGIKLLLERCEHLALDGNIISYILASDGGKQLKNLNVQNNDEVTAVINSSHAFPNLESLSLHNLVNLETVCCGQLIDQPFQKLRSLTLSNLPKLIGFSSKGSTSVVSTEAEEIILENEIGGPTILFMNEEVLMPNLTRLDVYGCGGLRFLFSSSMARSLVQLKNLTISDCQIMEAIVSINESSEEDTDHNMFSQLQDLSLHYLPNLTRFCSARRSINFHSLEILHLEDCSKLETIVFDPMSTNITINKAIEEIMDSTENIGTDARYFLFDEKVLMPNLTSLHVEGCDGLRFLFSSSMARSLVQLKNLTISSCQIMEEIVPTNKSSEEETDHNMFSQLQDLNLRYLPNLTRFCSARRSINFHSLEILHLEDCSKLETFVFDPMSTNITINKAIEEIRDSTENIGTDARYFLFDEKVGFPSLQSLIIRGLPVLRTIWHNRLAPDSFCKLKKVEVLRCNTLINIFAPSMMGRLNALDILKIRECKSLQVVTSTTQLKQLRQLTALDIHIPDAKLLPANMFSDTKLERYTILIGDCWQYHYFNETSSNMLKLKLTTNSQFDQGIKLLLERCEHLALDGNIISYILASDSGKQLKNLHVQNNDEVTAVINSSHAFPILESLSLENLVNLETLCCGQLIDQPFQKLRSLTLRNLPKLIGFSSKGSTSVVSREAEEIILENEIGGPTKLFMNGEVLMPNLTRLILHQCDDLRFLFSCSMARSLVQLEHIEISKCQMMEEIISTSGYNQEHTNNMFCNLKYLKLQHLPSITRFCFRSYIEFSLLETLHIEDCPRLGTFIFDRKSEGNPCPSLETLCSDTEIWYEAHDPLPAELFINLKAIQFSCAHPQSFHFLQKLHNLEKLDVCGGPWKEIFVYEGTSSGEIDAVGTTLPHIKNLSLTKMEELMHLGNDNSESIFPNLEILNVYDCGRLKNLNSSAISFHNLTALRVDGCMGLKYLVTYSVAKCLHQLKTLRVWSCESITDIVASNGDEEDSGNYYEIAFSSLQQLSLWRLPSLRGFCSSGNCTVRVPSLNSLDVEDCLIELKISPDGSLIQSGSRPERQQITEEAEEKEEEDDANETGGKQLIAHTN